MLEVERNIDCPLGLDFVMLTENYVSKKKEKKSNLLL